MVTLAQSAVEAAGAAVSTQEALVVATEYADTKIPVITMVMVSLGILLVVAASIAGLVYVVKRFKNWGPGLISGIIAQLLFGFLLYVAILFGLTKIPAFVTWSEEHADTYTIFQYLLSMTLSLLGILLGILYAVSSGKKKMIDMNAGIPLAFGVAFLFSSLMEGQQLTYPIEFVMICISVNKMGFDPAVASLIESGLTQEEAVASILELVNANWVTYICENLAAICHAVVNTCTAVLFFGAVTERMEKKWMGFSILLNILLWIPGLLGAYADLSSPVLLEIQIVLAAVVVYFTVKQIRADMPDDWKIMTGKGTIQMESKRKKNAEPPKMPKIKMPD